jgi:capsule polysaccharide modification protein KpsS
MKVHCTYLLLHTQQDAFTHNKDRGMLQLRIDKVPQLTANNLVYKDIYYDNGPGIDAMLHIHRTGMVTVRSTQSGSAAEMC